MKRLRSFFAVWLVMVFGLLRVISGHEGHAPLPTKGVEVDTERGLVTLSPEAQAALALQLARAEPGKLRQTTLAYARVVTPWQQRHFVSSRLPGRISQLLVKSGEQVEAGQLLAEIASPDLEGLVLQLQSAANDLGLTKRQYDLLVGLEREQIVNGREFIEIAARLEQQRLALETVVLKLRSLGIEAARVDELLTMPAGSSRELRLPIRAPLAGNVSHSDLAVGKVVVADEHLFEVNDLSKLWVEIEVLENDLPKIQRGQVVELELAAYPGLKLSTRVDVVGNEIDPRTHVARVWAEMPTGEIGTRFLPGMHGVARIVVSPDRELLTLPAGSLLGSGAERYVLVELASTKRGFEYRRQNVVVVAEDALQAQVQVGSLVPGDRVVSRGGHVLSSFFVLGSLRLSPEGMRNVGLQTAAAGMQTVEEILTFNGVIDLPPGGMATVSSQVKGTLFRLHVDREQEVAAGQIVAEVAGMEAVDPQLDLLQTEREVAWLEATLQRLQAGGQTQVVAAKLLWEWESRLNAARNKRAAAERLLLTLGMSREELAEVLQRGEPRDSIPIRSPIAGRVVRVNKTLGEGVGADESLLEVCDYRRVWAQGFLLEQEAGRIGTGLPARVKLVSRPDFLGLGQIVRSAQQIGEQDRTLSVWVEFGQPEGFVLQRNLLAELTATLSSSQSALAVPRSALARDGIRNYVFVQKPDGLLERRMVVVGRADDRWVEVRGGLQAGEIVAVQGVSELATTYAGVR
jgi:cobalt-zinc-cadmium efflux system membrane fusion protein